MPPYDKYTPQQKLIIARMSACKKFPYFTTALLSLIPEERPGLNTMGVTSSMLLYWDPEWFGKQTLDDAHAHSVDEAANCRIWNLAGDAEINDDLVGIFVADEWVLPKHFGGVNGRTAEEYYQILKEEFAKNKEKMKKAGGCCGSGAGHALEGEKPEGKGDGGGGNKDKGAAGGDAEGDSGRSLAEVSRIRRQTATEIGEHAASGRGSVPGGWKRWADETTKPPKVRWQDKLARATRHAIAFRTGAVDMTYRKPSRRQGGIGYGPGRPMLAALHAPKPNVMVVTDTSGSMGETELTAALREARGILLAAGGQITFGACDASMHGMRKVSNWAELPKLLLGGGGTSFIPIFEAWKKLQVKPGVIVVITDGDGDAPAEAPQGCKVVWLLTGPYARKPCEWGTHIFVKD